MTTVCETLTCPTEGCGYSPFPMDAGFMARARKTHETFYCPAGHSQYFAGKSKEEKLADEIASLERRIVDYRERLEEAQRSCRWIECFFVGATRQGLHQHMRAVHGMPTLAQVAEAS